MSRSIVRVLLVSLSLSGLAALAGCSGGPDSDEGTSAPAGGSGQGTKEPTKSSDSTSPAGDDDDGASIGPQCEAYFDCCDEVASAQPSLAGSCDQTRKSVEDATKKGASTATYESSCKQALATMQSAGYCK